MCVGWLAAVGDPLQLPPTLCREPGFVVHTRPTPEAPSLQSGAGASGTLERTLFSRLADAGRSPFVLLRTQYRCHPHIADLASRLFYGGKLVHGVAAEQRPAIVPGLPPVCIMNTVSGGARTHGRYHLQ